MTPQLEVILKTSFLMAAALVAVWSLARLSAAARHWILAAAIALAGILPAIEMAVPGWQLTLLEPEASDARIEPPSRLSDIQSAVKPVTAPLGQVADLTTSARPHVASQRLLRWSALWIAGSLVSFAALGVGFVRLRQLAAMARPVKTGVWRDACDRIASERRIRQPIALLAGKREGLLVTWGTVRPKIIIPRSALIWSPERVSAVLAHELAHIERRDWIAQLAGEFLRSIYWFNPLVWLTCRQLRRESELACDDVVIESGIGATVYAAHLVEVARQLAAARRPWLPVPAIVGSSFEKRIVTMLNQRTNRTPVSRLLRVVTFAVLLGMAVTIAAAQSSFATVSGVITDQNGGLIPNAKVALRHVMSEARYEVRTDTTGWYDVVGLRSGDYQLEVVLPGFSIYKDELTLSPGQRLSRNASLKVGSLEETINVVGGPEAGAKPIVRRVPPGAKVPALEPCSIASLNGSGGNIRPPVKLVDVRPLYPDNLRAAQAEGVVEMLATIGPDGKVEEIGVRSSPSVDMTASATEAVRQWEFSPTLLNCAPVAVNMTVRVNFKAER